MWQNYVVNENGKSALFSPMEKTRILEWHVANFLDTKRLTDIQLKLVLKVGLKIEEPYLFALKECFYPIHVYPLLTGHTFASKGVFDDVFSSKRTKFEMFKHVKLDKRFSFDSVDLKKNLRTLIFEMVRRKKFDKNQVASFLKSDENINRLEDFFDEFVLKDKITELNFQEFYARYFSRVEEFLVINEKLAGSAREHSKIGNSQKKQPQDLLLASENQFMNFYEENEKDQQNEIKDQKTPIHQNQIPINQNINKPEKTPENALREFRKSKFGLNELKYSQLNKDDHAFSEFMIRFFQSSKPIAAFGKNSFWPLRSLFQLKFLTPWKTHSEVLFHYFGEKITLYFKFSLFILSYLYWIMFIGLALWIFEFVIWYFPSTTLYYVDFGLKWVFVMMIIIWIGLFTYTWHQKEIDFRLSTGTSANSRKTERVNFKSHYFERSFENDDMNSKTQQSGVVVFKFVISLLATLLFYGVGFGATIAIFYLKNFVTGNNSNMFVEDYVYLNQNVVNIIEIIRMLLWDAMFRLIAIKLMNWVSPKFVEDYEFYLIYLWVIFTFFNHFFILLTIIFFKT